MVTLGLFRELWERCRVRIEGCLKAAWAVSLTHRDDKDGDSLGGDLTDEEEVEAAGEALTDEECRFLKQVHSW